MVTENGMIAGWDDRGAKDAVSVVARGSERAGV